MFKEVYYPQEKAIGNCICEVLTRNQQKYHDITPLSSTHNCNDHSLRIFISIPVQIHEFYVFTSYINRYKIILLSIIMLGKESQVKIKVPLPLLVDISLLYALDNVFHPDWLIRSNFWLRRSDNNLHKDSHQNLWIYPGVKMTGIHASV